MTPDLFKVKVVHVSKKQAKSHYPERYNKVTDYADKDILHTTPVKYFTYKGTPVKARAVYGQLKRNDNVPHFIVYLEGWKKNASTNSGPTFFGAEHELILEHWPELKDIIRYHGTRVDMVGNNIEDAVFYFKRGETENVAERLRCEFGRAAGLKSEEDVRKLGESLREKWLEDSAYLRERYKLV